MAVITRQANLGATLSEATLKMIYPGPCELLGVVIDYAAAADSGTVVTFKDGSSSGLTKFVVSTANTDIGTTVPVRVFHDARLIAGTATAGVGLGPVFFDGIHAAVTLDVTGPQSIRVFVRPLIKKSMGVVVVGASGSALGGANLYSGPGRVAGARVLYQTQPSGADVTFTDGTATLAGVASGRQLTIVSNAGSTDWAAVNQQLVTTTNIDEAGSAVTTAATGAYANDGVLFYTGLAVVVSQASLLGGIGGGVVVVEALIEGSH